MIRLIKGSSNKFGMKIYILAGIFLIAFGLRVWGISFGLPYNYHFDEKFYISAALNLGRGIFHTGPYNPTGLSNILFPIYGVYYLIGYIIGEFSSPQVFEAAYRADPTIFYLFARLIVIFLGAATTLALYLLGKASSSSKAGLLAAGLLAVNFLSVRDSHYAVPDIAMVFFIVLAAGLASYGLHLKRNLYIYLAGLAAGLAIAMKWTAFPVVAAVWWASVSVGFDKHEGISARLLNRTVILSMLAVAVGLTLGSPQILINPGPYIAHLTGLAEGDSGGGVISISLSKWLYYGKSIFYGGGIVLIVLGIVGALRRISLTVKARHPMSILLLSFPLGYFIINIVFGEYYFLRYTLPILPFMALFAAEIILVVWASQRDIGWRKVLVILFLIAAIVLPLVNSIQHDLILTRTDTRTLAKEWIEKNIPEGSKIAIDWPVHGPPLSTMSEAVPNSDRFYDIYIVGGIGLSKKTLAWYEEQGFDYLIASSYFYSEWNESEFPEQYSFYETLDNQLTLVKSFRSHKDEIEPPFIFDEIYGPVIGLWQRERPGPALKIYKIESEISGQG